MGNILCVHVILSLTNLVKFLKVHNDLYTNPYHDKKRRYALLSREISNSFYFGSIFLFLRPIYLALSFSSSFFFIPFFFSRQTTKKQNLSKRGRREGGRDRQTDSDRITSKRRGNREIEKKKKFPGQSKNHDK